MYYNKYAATAIIIATKLGRSDNNAQRLEEDTLVQDVQVSELQIIMQLNP